MSDATINRFLARGTTAQRTAFTPSAPTPSSGPSQGYLWWDTDLQAEYAYDFGLAAWVATSSGGAGTVTHTGSLTSGKNVVGNGTADVTVSSLSANLVASSSGTLAGAVAAANSKLVGSGTAGSGSAYAELTLGTNLSMSGTTLNASGGGTSVVVQVVNTETGASSTGTTGIPLDNTIPQITEGDEYMTLAITPASASNRLRIDVTVMCSNSFQAWLIAALFQDSTANALATGVQFMDTGTALQTINFSWFMTAGTTSATTFRVRAGKHVGATGTFNFNGGNGVGQLFGGTLASSITITEYTP